MCWVYLGCGALQAKAPLFQEKFLCNPMRLSMVTPNIFVVGISGFLGLRMWTIIARGNMSIFPNVVVPAISQHSNSTITTLKPLKPETLNPKPQTLHLTPLTLKTLKPETLNMNPKPSTLTTLKPETLYPIP